jgi:protein-S-isoprenylcysteine O-methyltransferase Ste14
MYLGMILMLIGAAILFGTLPFYGAAIAYFAIINWVFCPYEEDKLATAFGCEYETYRSQVRRWF